MRRRLTAAAALLLLLTATLFSISGGVDTLTPDLPFLDNGTAALVSAGETFQLGFFSPNGSTDRYIGIWYNRIPVQTVVWIANRRSPIISGSGNLSLTAAGTLVLTDGGSGILWTSGAPDSPLSNPVAQLLDNGNFAVHEAGRPDDFAWQSFDFPADTHIPGMIVGQRRLKNGTDLNINITASTSDSDPTPGRFVYGLDVLGDPQLFIWSGMQQYWRAGPWNGRWFSGVPEMVDTANGLLRFDVGPNQMTYLRSEQSSALLRFVMHSSGRLQLIVWLENRQSWNTIWYAPKDICDTLSSCGPNGYCRQIITPQCVCLQGFHPSNPRNWQLRDGTDGCLRTTPLDCRNGTDGFHTLTNTKLPDTSRSMVNASLTLDQCRASCLSNCDCTAYAALNISDSGNGCITWTTNLTDITVYQSAVGQELYVRLAAADLASEPSSDHTRRNHFVVIIVVLSVVIALLSCLAFCLWRRKKKKRGADIIEETEEKDLDLPLFDLGTIRNATCDFSLQNKLGEGGFGPVYKGKIGEDQEIAVKRLSKTSTQGLDEFKNEVTLIAKLQHRNLVRLLGCCVQEEERILVYEYMPNGSLDVFLFDEVKGTYLDWRTRYYIIVGIARGLLYLHHDSRFRIIHRDLKASNILLDKDMDPKISDFGMARIFGGDESEANTRRVVGTYGYMSPEYIMDGIFSMKSDVFSFGVLVLEIVSGKKNRRVYHTLDHLNLLGHIWNTWKEGNCLDFVDKNIGHPFPEAEVLRCIKIGLLCVQERAEDRPTMPSVLTMLGSTGNIALLPEPKQPGFFSKRVPLSQIYSSSSMSNQDRSSSNKITITNIEGR